LHHGFIRVLKKKEIRHQKRIELINSVRLEFKIESINRDEFRETVIYSQIKPFLDDKTINEIEMKITNLKFNKNDDCRGSGFMYLKNNVMDNLSRLEKKWNLI